MDDDKLLADLAGRLRDGHRRIASMDLPQDEKARIARRLLAISDAAKHDATRSSGRLDRFFADLDAGWRPGHDADRPATQ